MLAGGDFQKRRLSTVELRRFIGSGIAASAAAHLTILAVILVFAEVHPFSSVTAEPIAVDIVTPDEAAEIPKEEPVPPKPQPTDVFNFSATSAPSSSSASPAPQEGAVAKPQKQAALTPPLPDRQRKGVELPAPPPSAALPTPSTQFAPPAQSASSTQTAPQTPSAPANPAYVPPEPDLSVKYNVMLGLPPDSSGGGFDGPASDKADVASGVVAEFRRHLRTCSRLPPSIAPSDSVRIKLRVLMTPGGRIAAEPAVVEGSASLKALDLKQSAVDALQACQPYTMLPADRYREWKVLDLNFTPADFNS
jgi:hypothetical protein